MTIIPNKDIVNLSTIAIPIQIARQDKRTKEDQSSKEAEKKTNEHNTLTNISLSHKEGRLKHERCVFVIK